MSLIFPEQNSTNFPMSAKTNLIEIGASIKKDEYLRYHQYIVMHYLINNSDARGLLLFHEMGMGKSILATAVAEHYREHDPDRNIIVLLAKSLQKNFAGNISKYIKDQVKKEKISALTDDEIDNIIDEKYKFVSLNASNMFTQMTRVDKTSEELMAEKQLKEFTDIVEKDDFLENSVLIIDEYHNLANSITNGSYNAIRLYDTIMRTKNIKLIFLTGTPVVNNPFELVPTFNMLRGFIGQHPVPDEGNKFGKKSSKHTLFPELERDFNAYFVDFKKNKVKNKDRFQNRIFGMCSYYGSLYFGNKKKEHFPEEKPIKVLKVRMSPQQFAKYDGFRDLEIEEASSKERKVSRAERFSAKGAMTSSYRVKSRQVSNFLIPYYALTTRGKKIIKHIDKISKADLLNLDTFSPKFKVILNNINKHKNQKGLFYSEFVSGEGIALFAKVLKLKGYDQWEVKNDTNEFDIKLPSSSSLTNKTQSSSSKPEVQGTSKTKGGAKAPKFAIISGDISIEDREKIVNAFNEKSNMYGKDLALLLISKTGAEGLDLKCIRHVHICEPYWNYARISQIIARAVRYKSHEDLPKDKHDVQPYIYLSEYPKKFDMSKKKEETTDIKLYTDSVNYRRLINDFYLSLVEASIDCSAHEQSFDAQTKKQIKCKLCSPNNKPLYHPDISKDMITPDPCEELQTDKVVASEIDIDGVKYYYTKSKEDPRKFHIFKFNKIINGYVPLQPHEHHYSDIMRKLLKLG